MGRSRRVLPPAYFLLTILVMLGLHFLLPVSRLIHAPYTYLGVFPIGLGVTIAVSCMRLFKRANTAIRPFEESSALVTLGFYRYSRNPMYLSMVLALLGVGVVLGSLSPLLAVPPFILIIQQRFIRAEEAALREKFGSQYTDYRARVRRWM